MVLSKHVGETYRSFHDNYVFVEFIDLSVHDLCMSFVAHCVLKLGDPTSRTMHLEIIDATLSQRRPVAIAG